MIINYLNNKITIVAQEINDFITNIVDYTGITVAVGVNCVEGIDATIDTTDIIDNTKNIYIENNILYINPQYFSNNSVFVDGVYNITIKFNTTTGYTRISNCYFVDVTTRCKVASLLQNIIKENSDSNTEKVSTIAHLLQFSLVNGSNCGCNCQEMCDVFTALQDILSNIDTKLLNDCGC